MPYGFHDKAEAEKLCAKLAAAHPENKYEVAPHRWSEPLHDQRTPYIPKPITFGVVCWKPYCEVMPWRNTGFVWFETPKTSTPERWAL